MKTLVNHTLCILTITSLCIYAFAQQSSPPGMPSNPVGVVPWGSELITGICIAIAGAYTLLKSKREKY